MAELLIKLQGAACTPLRIQIQWGAHCILFLKPKNSLLGTYLSPVVLYRGLCPALFLFKTVLLRLLRGLGPSCLDSPHPPPGASYYRTPLTCPPRTYYLQSSYSLCGFNDYLFPDRSQNSSSNEDFSPEQIILMSDHGDCLHVKVQNLNF